MAKQLNIDLRFNADTSQAKKAIQDLQNTLNNLSSLGTAASTNGFNQQIASATVEANKLKIALTDAFNIKTGAIDLSKLQANLRQAGSSIEQVSNSLINMGPVGQRAFQQFAATIAQAQVPTMRLNGMLGEMWTTLKNVARFQISSSIIHGLIGGVQSAFSYAQNLNESLNNIRIVTGQSSEQMARFAREANSAAKALSSTTLDYTNASLIYYQQGLNDSEVRERTDVTIKMANVTRESAEEVSEQMTAIWNNFDDGSKSLEYYADVITALGAATASSSAEISTGLQKFAAVADTVGLSYENATAALATITATTRQSADTVGTGLRTLFSRLQGLSLGKTLEDGVNLNKYSKALQTVGVQALDSAGNLRAMDDVLEDLGERWGQLSKAQQTALAQTVGGVRQYTTLIALMDNWDFMKQNQQVAAGAEGTLQSQADIYAESWEAARDRIQAALQGLYDSLINDDFFIDLLNGIEKLITGVDNFVQSLGGAKGVILGVAAAILSFANAGVSNAISNMTYNIMSLTGAGQKRADEMRDNIINKALAITPNGSEVQKAESQVMQNQVRLQQVLNTYGKEYNAIQKQIAQSLVQQQQSYDQQVVASHEALRDVQLRIKVAEQQRDNAASERERERIQQHITDLTLEEAEIKEQLKVHIDDANKSLQSTEASLKNLTTSTMSGADIFAAMASGATSAIFAVTTIINAVKTLGDESVSTGQKIQTLLLNIPMGLTMAASAWKNGFGKIWSDLKGNVFNSNTKQLADQAAQFVETQVGGSIIKKKGGLVLEQAAGDLTKGLGSNGKVQLGDKQSLEIFTQSLGISKERTAEIAKQVALEATEKNLSKEETAELLKQKIAEEGITKAALLRLGKYALIAAAIAAVVAAIYLAVKAYNADADAAKKAAEAHKELQQKSKDAAQELQNIKQAFDGYDSAVKALEECTKCTDEWYQALKAVNNEVLSIMENNPKLAAQMQTHRDKETGMLVIDNQQELIDQAQTIADNARNAAIMGAVNASEAQLKSDTTDFTRRFGATYADDGTQIGGVEGLGKILSNLSDFTPRDTEGFAKAIEKLKIDISMVDIESFRESVWELTQANIELANITENSANAIAESKLGDKYSGAVKEVASEAYETAYKTAYNEALKAGTEGINIWSGKNDDEVIDFWRRYSEATGTTFSLASNAIIGNDNNRYFQYLNNGKTEKVSLEEMAAAIAAAEALEKLTGSANEASNVLANLSSKTDIDTAKILENFVANGNLESATQEQFENIQSKVESAEYTDETGKKYTGAEAYLRNMLGDTLVNSAPELVERFEKALELNFDDIGKNLKGTTAEAFNSISEQIKNLTYTEQESIVSIFDSVSNALGTTGTSLLSQIYSSLDPEEIASFTTVLSSMDWDTAGPDSFQLALKAAGVETSKATELINLFAGAMRQITQNNLSSAQTFYKETNDLIKDAVIGTQYNTEDWTKLSNIGIEGLETFFELMPDGSRILIRDAEEFYNLVSNAERDRFENAIKSAQERVNAIENYNGVKYNPQDIINTNSSIKETAENIGDNDFINSLESSVQEGWQNQLNAMLKVLEFSGQNVETYSGDEVITGDEFNEIAGIFKNIVGDSESWDALLEGLGEAAQKELEEALESLQNFDLFSEFSKNNLDASEVIKYADNLKRLNEELDENEKLIGVTDEQWRKLAAKQMLLERGTKSLSDNFEEFYELLGKDQNTEEFSESLDKMREGLEDIAEGTGIDFNFSSLGPEFFKTNKPAIEKAIAGDLTDLRQVLTAETAKGFKLPVSIEKQDEIQKELQTLIAKVEQHDIRIGASIDDTDFVNGLNEMLAAGEITVDQANKILSGMGYVPDIQEQEVHIGGAADDGSFAQQTLEIDGKTITVNSSGSMRTNAEGYVSVPFINAETTTYTGKGGKGGSSSKSGGGGSSAKKHKTKKADSGTRYHTVKEKQSDNERKAQQAEQAAERAFGQTRINNLKQQIELQKESVDLQRQYIDEINNYLAGDRNKMQDFFANNFNIKFSFDENGVIENYQEIEDKLLNWYNNNANKELTDEQWEKVEEQYEQAKEYLSMYEETLNLSEEQLAELTNKLNELADLYLKLTQEQVEMRIDVSDDQLKMLEYQLEKIEDDAYKTAEAIALLGDQTQNTLDRVSIYENGLDDLLRHHGVTLEELQNMDYVQLIDKGFTDEEIQQMRDWVEQVLDANKQLLEMRTNVIDKVIDGLDALNDKVSESYDLFSHYNDVLEDYRNITDLLGGRIGNAQSNAIVNSLNRVALQNAENTIASARNNYEALQRMQADALEHYNEAVGLGNTGAAEEWERVLIDVQEKLNDAQSEFLQTWQDGLDAAQKALEDAVDASVESYEKGLAPLFGSLESLRDAYDKQKEVDELYLQDYDRLYELSKLNRDLQAAIDDTNNIKGKQRLRDLQAEINKLQADGNKLSEYDVEVLRKRFELEQARQAVEDARNAKSQVRLRRDSEGNWGYVYTASEDEVAKAQQAYEDKLHEYQELNDEYITELQEKALDVQSDYAEQFAEIMKDTTLNDEQRAERLKSLNNWFTNEMAAFDDQMNNALENQASTLERYYKAYGDLRAELIDQFDETRLSSLTNKDNVVAYMENVMSNYNTLNEQGQAVITQYEEDVNRILAAAGSNLDIYSDQVAQAMINIGTQSDATKDKVFELSAQMEQSFGESLEAALSWEEEYGRLIDEAIKHNEDFLHSIYEMIAALTMLGSQDSKYLEALQAYQSAEMAHRDFVSKNGDKEDSAWESAQTAWRNYISDWMASWSSTPTRFYTGGYTGDWAGDGRLAVLDQKELVLNREDTTNFLAAADILRTLDMNANILSNGLGSIYNPFFGGIGNQTLDQNVHIVAEFPNVQDRNEIEAAFESLVNRASQYANRKS